MASPIPFLCRLALTVSLVLTLPPSAVNAQTVDPSFRIAGLTMAEAQLGASRRRLPLSCTRQRIRSLLITLALVTKLSHAARQHNALLDVSANAISGFAFRDQYYGGICYAPVSGKLYATPR